MERQKLSIFIDCGAPSLYNKLSRVNKDSGAMGASFSQRKYDDYTYVDSPEYKKYRDEYIEFLHNNMDRIGPYSNLDVINNPKLTYRNQKILERSGLKPIPVFHLGGDLKYLVRYIDNHEYIAIGGLKRTTTGHLLKALDSLWKNYLLDDQGYPRVKVHGFANTSFALMKAYPWFSVDSATCRKLGAFGHIVLPEHSTDKLNIVTVSSRDVKSNFDIKITRGIQRSIDERGKQYGLTLKELSESSISRMIWNYFIYLDHVRKHIPKWPWNHNTRQSKDDANDLLNFYIAGELSKAEETAVWESFLKYRDDEELRCRLISFYYNKEIPVKLY